MFKPQKNGKDKRWRARNTIRNQTIKPKHNLYNGDTLRGAATSMYLCCVVWHLLYFYLPRLSTGSWENENRKVVMDIAKIHKQKDVWLNGNGSNRIIVVILHSAMQSRQHTPAIINVNNHFPWTGTMISEVLLWKWVDSGSGVVFMVCHRSYSHHSFVVMCLVLPSNLLVVFLRTNFSMLIESKKSLMRKTSRAAFFSLSF